MSVAFLLTTLVVVATPGTGVLITVAAGLGRGPRASVVAAFGCTLGIVPHLAAAVTGLAALLHASGVAFATLKYAGIAYLLVMAWSTWRERGALLVEPDRARRSDARLVAAAVLANLLNPKLTLFFFAFLPQFVGPGGAVGAMLLLSAVFMAFTFVVFCAYGLFAAAVRDRLLRRPSVLTWLRRTFAVSFVALAGRLATTDR